MKVNFLKFAVIMLAAAFYLAACTPMMAETEDVINKSFDVSSGGTLIMDVDGASIEVETGSSDKVEIKVIRKARTSSKRKAEEIFEDYEIEFDQKENDVIIESDYHRGKKLFNWGNRIRVKFIVTVPDKYHLDVKTSGGSIRAEDIEGDVKAKTSGGSLSFAHVKGELWGRTSGGSIKLQGCTGDADVKTSGGSIRIGKVKGEVTAITSGGSITVEEVKGTINAVTSGGSVKASISEQPQGDCKLKTSGGSVTVNLAEGIELDLEAKTSGGRVHVNLPVSIKGKVSKKYVKGELNGGGPLLYLKTSGGSIRINKY